MGVLEENIKAFSSEKAVELYTSSYLRKSERYVITKYMSRGKRILDVGCGAGRTTKHIDDEGADVIGIDLAPALIARAKELYPDIDFKVMNVLQLAFEDEAFDVVFFSFNGIDNLYPESERVRALKEMKRVLKDGGLLIYSSHNALCIPHTKGSLVSFFMNFFRLRLGLHWRVSHQSFGKLIQCYTTLRHEKRTLNNLGMRIVEIVANSNHCSNFHLNFFERFPMFVAQK